MAKLDNLSEDRYKISDLSIHILWNLLDTRAQFLRSIKSKYPKISSKISSGNEKFSIPNKQWILVCPFSPHFKQTIFGHCILPWPTLTSKSWQIAQYFSVSILNLKDCWNYGNLYEIQHSVQLHKLSDYLSKSKFTDIYQEGHVLTSGNSS